MILSLVNNDFEYEMQKLCMLFLPYEKIIMGEAEDGQDLAVAKVEDKDGGAMLSAFLRLGGAEFSEQEFLPQIVRDDKEIERRLAVLLFNCFCKATNRRPPWGILTGVRPAKLMGRLCRDMGRDSAAEYFKNELLVSDAKTNLCLETHDSEEKITSLSAPESASLYVSIPFCPSRCAYCSFVSHSVENAGKLIDDYIALLCREIAETGKIARELSLKIETVYIGGGTPTVLSPEQLSLITSAIKNSFDLSHCREYTIEAGRPDTITLPKLQAIKQGGADRICINPQTMNDTVLAEIGRKHNSAQTLEAFALARKAGFENINMDVIAGLPLDTAESFEQSLRQIADLDPEEITVHSLAMKRASRLTAQDYRAETAADEMVDFAARFLPQKGLKPYYMYRQSKTVGNLENVGYAKEGAEGLYNVFIMDETHTILGCGASAVTKLRRYGQNEIERIFNFKYPYEYISRFEEMLARKSRITEFYNE